jgi:hypothetical protein
LITTIMSKDKQETPTKEEEPPIQTFYFHEELSKSIH